MSAAHTQEDAIAAGLFASKSEMHRIAVQSPRIMMEKYNALRIQRDELLAALLALKTSFENHEFQVKGIPAEMAFGAAIEMARNAIAKATQPAA